MSNRQSPWPSWHHVLCFVCVCLFVGGWQPSLAQADMAKAQAAYSLGFDAYKKKSFRTAHRHFRRAYREAPASKAGFRGVLLFFSGMCEYRLRRWSSARRTLRQFLGSGKGRASHRAEAKAALGKAELQLRRLAALRRAKQARRARPPRRVSRPAAVYIPPRPRPRIVRTPTPRPVAPRPAAPISPTSPTPGGRLTTRTPRRAAVGKVVARGRVIASSNRRPAPTQRSGPSPAAYVLIGIGAAAAVTGGVLVGAALGTEASALAAYKEGQAKPANERPPAQDVIEPLNNARTMSYASYALLGGGVALAAAGVIVFFVTKGRPVANPPKPAKTTTELRISVLFP